MSTISNNYLITLDSVTCRFRIGKGVIRRKEYIALKDISLQIVHGETLGLIGRNGSGKSTLLKLIGGIYRPDAGRIHFRSRVSVSLLSLHAGMDPELPGSMNALLGAMFLGFSKQEAMAKLDRIIAFAELEDWRNEPLKSYSTGMRARLGFAVALEMSPDVLLIDEVLGVGDQRFKQKSVQAMKDKMLSDQTIVFVSHTLPQVKELCDRVVWLEQGGLQMIGETEEVIQAYQQAQQ